MFLSGAAKGADRMFVDSHSLYADLLFLLPVDTGNGSLMRLWVADQCLLTLPHPPGIFPSHSSLVPTHYFSFIADANFTMKFIFLVGKECSPFVCSVCGRQCCFGKTTDSLNLHVIM